jgi:hypothetical protein
MFGTAIHTNAHSPWKVECRDRPCRCFYWWELPFWVQAQFVGLEVAKEAAAAYYRSGVPTWFSEQLEMLDGMLSTDHFHLGVRPADHLRRFEIDLKMLAFELNYSYGEHEDIDGIRAAFKQQLPALLKLRMKRGFELALKTSWSPYSPRLIGVDILDDMLPIVTTLREAGTQICMLARHPVLEKNLDVSDYFTLPLEQWVPKWSAKIESEIQEKNRALRSASGDPGSTDSEVSEEEESDFGEECYREQEFYQEAVGYESEDESRNMATNSAPIIGS